MSELITFCLSVLTKTVNTYLGLNLGGYSFGLFVVATSVISIFVGTLVISFRGAGGPPGQFVRAPRTKRKS